MRFEGRVALITGAGRGIGRAIAVRLAQEGADVVVDFFRNRTPAEATAAEIRALGRRAVVVRANVGDPGGIEALFAATREAFGSLDFLICNAASGYNRPVLEQTPKGWDWTMNINARSLLLCAQQSVPLMRGRAGRIVSLSSPGSSHVLPDYAVVGASKAAIEALTRYLAVELAPYGIVVNAVSPGVVATDALKHFDATRSGDLLPRLAAAMPAGRLVTAEDVASVVAFLCSDEAEMIRGQTIVVDGGALLLGTGLLASQPSDEDA